jgi:hypothetical protein
MLRVPLRCQHEEVARLIHVHVRTLHAAAKDGRLLVTYDTRTTFRRLRSRATLADAEIFLHRLLRKSRVAEGATGANNPAVAQVNDS